eukprot:GHVL01040073.1.p1 GENE.GHVL01040073.1~~GHVL01040073.1.p1  ORF type:complete len:174 (+),score=35.99 GHVL01040073.1:401-922(+)
MLVKANCFIRDIPADILLYHIRHIPTRRLWDSTFCDFRVLQVAKNENDCEIIYSMIKAPFPIANRDFVQYRRYEYNNNIHMILHRSAYYEGMPINKNIIRADTIISGYIIREVSKSSCSLFILAQTDIKGMIPKAIVNTAAVRSPMQWVTNIKNACAKWIKEKGLTVPPYNPY